MESNEPHSNPQESTDVYRVDVDGRRFIVVGTAHISQESVDLVRSVIETEQPDRVCVELDEQRHAALTEAGRWEALDLRQIISDGQLAIFILNVMLMSFQKRLGGKLGVMPGSELVAAVRTAEECGIPISLCDRDIRATMGRAWQSVPWYRKLWLAISTLAKSMTTPELDEAELRRLRQRDVMTELMSELGASFPSLKRVLIDERDAYLAQCIRDSEGETIVAVVGAGHVAGMCEALESHQVVSLDELDTVPPSSPVWRYVGWAIPVAVVSMIVAIGLRQGLDAAGDNILFWVIVNCIPTAIGAVIAIGHPLTIAAAFVVAPFTSLTPLIGAGYVAAFTQAWVRPPRIHEFQSVSEDVTLPARWWSSRLLRVFLVFILTSIFGALGTWVGGYEIFSNLIA